MALRDLQPLGVLAGEILSSKGSFFSGVRRDFLDVKRGELVRILPASCGGESSSYLFEGNHQIITGEVLELSVQHLIDC
ncbi:unnamed protein product [Urochloa humidicola]